MNNKCETLKLFCEDSIKKIYSEKIAQGLRTDWLGKNINYFHSLESTQTESHKLAGNQALHGSIVIAGEQTKGRGRLGKNWHSEKDKGIWMSIILRPSFDIKYASHITLLTSIVINSTLKNLYNIDSRIKWPNDIYINSKKCAGILCEVREELDTYYLVVGIGINTHKTEYPDIIKHKATSIEEILNRQPKKIDIIIELLNVFEQEYEVFIKEGFSPFYHKYIDLMYGINEKVTHNNNIAYIKGIDEEGHLVLEKGDGNIYKIASGEIHFL